MLRLLILLFSLPLLQSCISMPEVASTEYSYEYQLSCNDLVFEVQRAEELKQGARKDDRFMLRHLSPISGIASIFTMNNAEKAAEDRLAFLKQLQQQKRCPPASALASNPMQTYPGATPYNTIAGQPGSYPNAYQAPPSVPVYPPTYSAAYPPIYPPTGRPTSPYGTDTVVPPSPSYGNAPNTLSPYPATPYDYQQRVAPGAPPLPNAPNDMPPLPPMPSYEEALRQMESQQDPYAPPEIGPYGAGQPPY